MASTPRPERELEVDIELALRQLIRLRPCEPLPRVTVMLPRAGTRACVTAAIATALKDDETPVGLGERIKPAQQHSPQGATLRGSNLEPICVNLDRPARPPSPPVSDAHREQVRQIALGHKALDDARFSKPSQNGGDISAASRTVSYSSAISGNGDRPAWLTLSPLMPERKARVKERFENLALENVALEKARFLIASQHTMDISSPSPPAPMSVSEDGLGPPPLPPITEVRREEMREMAPKCIAFDEASALEVSQFAGGISTSSPSASSSAPIPVDEGHPARPPLPMTEERTGEMREMALKCKAFDDARASEVTLLAGESSRTVPTGLPSMPTQGSENHAVILSCRPIPDARRANLRKMALECEAFEEPLYPEAFQRAQETSVPSPTSLISTPIQVNEARPHRPLLPPMTDTRRAKLRDMALEMNVTPLWSRCFDDPAVTVDHSFQETSLILPSASNSVAEPVEEDDRYSPSAASKEKPKKIASRNDVEQNDQIHDAHLAKPHATSAPPPTASKAIFAARNGVQKGTAREEKGVRGANQPTDEHLSHLQCPSTPFPTTQTSEPRPVDRSPVSAAWKERLRKVSLDIKAIWDAEHVQARPQPVPDAPPLTGLLPGPPLDLAPVKAAARKDWAKKRMLELEKAEPSTEPRDAHLPQAKATSNIPPTASEVAKEDARPLLSAEWKEGARSVVLETRCFEPRHDALDVHSLDAALRAVARPPRPPSSAAPAATTSLLAHGLQGSPASAPVLEKAGLDGADGSDSSRSSSPGILTPRSDD